MQLCALGIAHDAPDQLGVVVEHGNVVGRSVECLGDGDNFIVFEKGASRCHALAAVAIPEELAIAVGDDVAAQLSGLGALGAREGLGH